MARLRRPAVRAALALAFCAGFTLPAPAAANVRERELHASVTLSGACSASCRGTVFGAGEIVGRRGNGDFIVVTARHIVDAMRSPRIFLHADDAPVVNYRTLQRGSFGASAALLATASDADLALLTFRPASPEAYASLATLATGTAVPDGSVVGGPYGKLWTVSPYRYSSAASDGSFLIDCASCGPGDSGGGVFDADGGLTGILVSEQRLLEADRPGSAGARTLRFKVVAASAIASLLNFARAESVMPTSTLRTDPWSRFSADLR